MKMEERGKNKFDAAAGKAAVAIDAVFGAACNKFEEIEHAQREILEAIAEAMLLAADNARRLDKLELRLGIVKAAPLADSKLPDIEQTLEVKA
jgi:hypothetical protein